MLPATILLALLELIDLLENFTWYNTSNLIFNSKGFVMRQTACLVANPIIVDGYASLFICTTAVRASDSMTASS